MVVQVLVEGLKRTPFCSISERVPTPPHTIICVPVQAVPALARAESVLSAVIAVQTPALYRAPSLRTPALPRPPHMIMSLPVHTALWPARADGAPLVVKRVHMLLLGS